jgi:hypothetical protein
MVSIVSFRSVQPMAVGWWVLGVDIRCCHRRFCCPECCPSFFAFNMSSAKPVIAQPGTQLSDLVNGHTVERFEVADGGFMVGWDRNIGTSVTLGPSVKIGLPNHLSFTASLLDCCGTMFLPRTMFDCMNSWAEFAALASRDAE